MVVLLDMPGRIGGPGDRAIMAFIEGVEPGRGPVPGSGLITSKGTDRGGGNIPCGAVGLITSKGTDLPVWVGPIPGWPHPGRGGGPGGVLRIFGRAAVRAPPAAPTPPNADNAIKAIPTLFRNVSASASAASSSTEVAYSLAPPRSATRFAPYRHASPDPE